MTNISLPRLIISLWLFLITVSPASPIEVLHPPLSASAATEQRVVQIESTLDKLTADRLASTRLARVSRDKLAVQLNQILYLIIFCMASTFGYSIYSSIRTNTKYRAYTAVMRNYAAMQSTLNIHEAEIADLKKRVS